MEELEFDFDVDDMYTAYKEMYYSPYSFEETLARFYSLLGARMWKTSDKKSMFEIKGTFRGKVFTLYDYKEDMSIHIGTKMQMGRVTKEEVFTKPELKALCRALDNILETVEPKSYKKQTKYDQKVQVCW